MRMMTYQMISQLLVNFILPKTNWTLVTSVGMQLLVHTKPFLCLERRIASVARKRTVIRMRCLMLFQSTRIPETLPTIVTTVFFLPGMRGQMTLELRLIHELFLAVTIDTRVTIIKCMKSDFVRVSAVGVLKGLWTIATIVRFSLSHT